jgi:hypothetical protein
MPPRRAVLAGRRPSGDGDARAFSILADVARLAALDMPALDE